MPIITFEHWITLQENLTIAYADDESEEAGDAYDIAQKVGIRVSRNKHLTFVALLDDKVIGAVYTDVSQQHNSDQSEYSFDVVVDPQYQGYQQVGIKLIQQADKYRYELEDMYPNLYTRLHVVNPKLINVLNNKFNYDIVTQQNGQAIMVKY